MPRRRRRRRFSRRSRSYVRRGRSRARRTVRRRRRRLPLAGFTKKRTVRLRYVQSVNLDGGAGGALQIYTFRANSMYDPDYTGTGHQPRGFDQAMVGYDHFTVIGSKISVALSPTYAQATLINTNPGVFGCVLTNDGVVNYAAAEEVMEGTQGAGYRTFGYPGTATGPNRLSKTFSATKFFGKKYLPGSADYKGSASGNPGQVAYYSIWAAGVGGTDPGNVLVTVTIDYIAVLTEPKYIPRSI